MGRWAQAKRRGTVSPGETVRPSLPAPVYGVDWQILDANADTFTAEAITSVASFMLVNMVTTEHPLSASQGLDAAPGNITVPPNDGVAGNHYSATAAWSTIAGAPLSPLSTAHTGLLE